MSQRQLAAKLGRERSFVGRIEVGDRRVDLVEFHWICRACGYDPVEVGTELLEEFAKLESQTRTRRTKKKTSGSKKRARQTKKSQRRTR